MTARGRTVTEMGLREYGRTPVLLVLLLVLPGYMIAFFSRVVPADPVRITVPVQGAMAVPMTDAVTVVMGPLVAGLIGGIAGLFLLQSASDVDGRLAIVGTPLRSILLGRGLVLAVAALVTSVVSIAVLSLGHVPVRPGWFLLALLTIALIYGTIGGVVGLVFNRLAGIYVVMFVPLLDLFLAQSPFATDPPAIAPLLPGHFPSELALDAAFTPAITTSNVVGAIGYLLLVAVIGGAAYYQAMRVR
jgi:ABC-2 type transport system permease protein